MGQITDQLRKRTLRSAMKSEVPDWWPAAQILGAAALVLALVIASFVQLGNNDDPSSDVVTQPTAAPITAAPITAPADTTPGGTTPGGTVPSTTAAPVTNPTTPPGGTTAPAGGLPTPVDDRTVSIRSSDGTSRAIPLAAWLAARDSVLLVYQRAVPTAATLLSAAGTSYTLSVTITTDTDTFAVQTTAVLQSDGTWAAA